MGEIVLITYHLYYESPGIKEVIRARRRIAAKVEVHEKQCSIFGVDEFFPLFEAYDEII